MAQGLAALYSRWLLCISLRSWADHTSLLASQNFFRSYPKLAGMTGTAATEVAEFNNIYNLNVAVVPTNKVRTMPTCCITARDGATLRHDCQHARSQLCCILTDVNLYMELTEYHVVSYVSPVIILHGISDV